MNCTKIITDKMEPQKGKSPEVTPDSILEMLTQDFLKCHICLNTFTSPTYLDCHHTFCLSCLEALCNSLGSSCNELDCPDCRDKTSLMGAGTSALKPNFMMASLVDAVANQRRQLRILEGAIVCSVCNKEVHAALQCDDCDVRLCQDCWMENESDHVDHLLDVIDPNLSEKPPTAPKCNKHRELSYCFYCTTCEALICALCAATSHRGPEHEHQSIDEADDSTRQEIGLLLSRSDKRLQDNLSTKYSIENQRKSTEAKLTEAETHITEVETDDYDKAQRLNNILEDFRTFQAARLDDFSKVLDDVQANVEFLHSACDQLRQRVANADKYQLLQHKEELVMRIQGILDNEIPTPELKVVASIKLDPGPKIQIRLAKYNTLSLMA